VNVITKTRILLRILDAWAKIEKYLNEQEKLNMKLSVNVIAQALALALQALNQVSDLLPGKAKFWALVAITAIQGVVGILAHFSNTNGTPQAVAFVKQ
jgi:hypothetical protein